MKKNYNYKRRKLYLPEYGRHIQEMVDSLLQIDDRRERILPLAIGIVCYLLCAATVRRPSGCASCSM